MIVLLATAILPLPNLSTHRVVKAEVDVHASAHRVWEVLTDFAAYPIWNPYIYPAKGQLVPGETLDLTLHGSKTTEYTFKVVAAKPNEELRWTGRMPNPTIDRTLTFTIRETAPFRVHFTAEESFTGIMLPLASQIPDEAAGGLDAMSKMLRSRAEILDYGVQHPASAPRVTAPAPPR